MEISDVIVDCTPGKFGASNHKMYSDAGVKAMFQGGEKHDLTGTSFNSFANYSESLGKQFVRVVSCNTTGLCRTLYPLEQKFGIDNVFAVMIRRAVDPRDSKKGPVNAIEPVLKVPSHHGPDVQTCMHDLSIQTMAVKVPTTLMHLHAVKVDLKSDADTSAVQALYDETTRVKLIEGGAGLKSTAEIMEFARDMGRPRSDLNEIAVWRDGINVDGKILYYYQAIHQESDVVPENIDCIRAMMEMETDNWKSIEKTNKALGIK
jgi:glyceraldehyde-3-phosphate dehydrogenase (NAD(P))